MQREKSNLASSEFRSAPGNLGRSPTGEAGKAGSGGTEPISVSVVHSVHGGTPLANKLLSSPMIRPRRESFLATRQARSESVSGLGAVGVNVRRSTTLLGSEGIQHQLAVMESAAESPPRSRAESVAMLKGVGGSSKELIKREKMIEEDEEELSINVLSKTKIDRWTLRFSNPKIERQFVHNREQEHIMKRQSTLMLYLTAVCIGIVVTATQTSELLASDKEVLGYLGGLGGAALLILLIFAIAPLNQTLNALTGPLFITGVSLALMALTTGVAPPTPGGFDSLPLILHMLGYAIFLRMLFWVTAPSLISITIIYVVLYFTKSVRLDGSIVPVYEDIGFFVLSTIVLAVSNYISEHSERSDFLSESKLSLEHAIIYRQTKQLVNDLRKFSVDGTKALPPDPSSPENALDLATPAVEINERLNRLMRRMGNNKKAVEAIGQVKAMIRDPNSLYVPDIAGQLKNENVDATTRAYLMAFSSQRRDSFMATSPRSPRGSVGDRNEPGSPTKDTTPAPNQPHPAPPALELHSPTSASSRNERRMSTDKDASYYHSMANRGQAGKVKQQGSAQDQSGVSTTTITFNSNAADNNSDRNNDDKSADNKDGNNNKDGDRRSPHGSPMSPDAAKQSSSLPPLIDLITDAKDGDFVLLTPSDIGQRDHFQTLLHNQHSGITSQSQSQFFLQISQAVEAKYAKTDDMLGPVHGKYNLIFRERVAKPAGTAVAAGNAAILFHGQPPAGSAAMQASKFIPAEVELMLQKVSDWSFDIFKFNKATQGRPISFLGPALFDRLNLQTALNIDALTFLNFCRKLDMTYRDLPYHNNIHGADVAQSMYSFLTRYGMKHHLNEIEIAACIVGSFIHDLDHPGTNNAYQTNVLSDFSLLYSDRAVLENYHLSRAFHIMTDPNCNVFKGLDKPTFKRIRKIIIELVLATDMGSHFEIMSKFSARIDQLSVQNSTSSSSGMGSQSGSGATPTPTPASTGGGTGGAGGGGGGHGTPATAGAGQQTTTSSTLSVGGGGARASLDFFGNEADRILFMKLAIKTSDISNPCRDLAVHRHWTAGYVEETFLQGDMERARNIPISPFMDRFIPQIPKCEVGFFEFIIIPMWNAWNLALKVDEPLKNLDKNLKYWKNQVQVAPDAYEKLEDFQ